MGQIFSGRDIVEEVRARTDIVSVVSEYVSLKKAGKNLVGLCPFHHERTPSFTVSPDKQMFYCFGCGKGGDVFSFLMLRENLTFGEALRILAERAGVKIGRADLERGSHRKLQEIRRALEWAAEKFRRLMESETGKECLEYLKSRGLTTQTIARFQLGYAPPHWDFLVRAAHQDGVPEEALLEAGLLVKRSDGGYYDRFRDRVVFPIWDGTGRVVGFAGRVLHEGEPKYLNSPDTPVFHKGRHWYALHLAREGIRRTRRAVVMEGYMDVITCHQFGLDNCVAGMGTSLTPEQARALLLMGSEVVLAYDSDPAGLEAAERAITVFRQAGGRVKVVSLQEGKDPDEYIRAYGAEAFLRRLDEAVPDLLFLYRKYAGECGGDKVAIKEKMVPVLALIESKVELAESVREVAGAMGVLEGDLRADVESYQKKYRKTQYEYKKSENRNTTTHGTAGGQPGGKVQQVVRERAERGLIRALLEEPKLLSVVGGWVTPDMISDPFLRNLFRTILGYFEEPGDGQGSESGKNPGNLLRFVNDSMDDEGKARVARLLMEEEELSVPRERLVKDYVMSIRKAKSVELERELKIYEASGDIEKQALLLKKIQELRGRPY